MGSGFTGLNGGPLFRSRVRSEAERELGGVSCPDKKTAARAMTTMAGPLRGADGTASAL